MADMVLKCTKCGTIDDSHVYETADEASSQLQHWACSRCAWTEWELVPKTEREAIELGAPQR